MIEAPHRVPGRHVIRGGVAVFGTGWKRPGLVSVLHQPLEAQEVMEPVPDDRSADGAAPLLFADVRLGRIVLFREVVPRRDFLPGEEVEQGARELIGSRFRHGVDHGARRAAVLRVELVGHDLDFLDRFVSDACLAADVRSAEVVDVAGPVEHDVVGRGRLPVGEHRVVEEAGGGNEHRSRNVPDKRHVASISRRQLGELLSGNVAAHLRRAQVDKRRLGCDGDGFVESTDFQRQVECLGSPHCQEDVAPIEGPEALQLRTDPVPSRNNLRCKVAPIGARDDLAKGARVLVGDDDRHAGQDAALRIGDLPADFRGACLRERRCGDDERDADDQAERECTHLPLPVESARGYLNKGASRNEKGTLLHHLRTAASLRSGSAANRAACC